MAKLAVPKASKKAPAKKKSVPREIKISTEPVVGEPGRIVLESNVAAIIATVTLAVQRLESLPETTFDDDSQGHTASNEVLEEIIAPLRGIEDLLDVA